MNIPKISLNQHYWFVRTQHGEFYEDFVHGDFVGIGWNAVTASHLKDHTGNNEILQELVIEEDPDIKRSAWAVGQIHRFVMDIGIGDIVIVPSKNSRYLSFGRVMSNVFEEDVPSADLIEGACPYRKRRNVDWFKTLKRTELDPYLYRLFYSQHVITDAADYAPYIDRALHSFFLKGDVYYMVIRITSPARIA